MKDLHIHTIYSDGEYDEYKIIDEIQKSQVKEFAICDHDTLEGSRRVFELLQKKGTDLIFHPGVELTCRYKEYGNGINMHILVQDFDYEDKNLQDIVKEISSLRKKKIDRMIKFIQKEFDISIPLALVEEKASKTFSFGKPHMYSILTTISNITREEYYDAMDRLDSEDLKLDARSTILSLKGNAKIILAHPIEIMKEYDLNLTEIECIISDLKDFGLTGIETHHSAQDIKTQQALSQIATRLNLEESMGSDFHGPNVKPNIHIGQTYKEI